MGIVTPRYRLNIRIIASYFCDFFRDLFVKKRSPACEKLIYFCGRFFVTVGHECVPNMSCYSGEIGVMARFGLSVRWAASFGCGIGYDELVIYVEDVWLCACILRSSDVARCNGNNGKYEKS